MSRFLFRSIAPTIVLIVAVFLWACGSASIGSNTGSGGSSSGPSVGGFAAGMGSSGQTGSAHFLIGIQVPGVTPIPTTIGAAGTLTTAAATVSPYTVFNPMAMDAAIDPTGSFFYQAAEPGIWAFTIDRQNGNLTEMSGSPYDPTVKFETVTVDQLGKFVYAFAAGQVYAYSIQSGSGQLTAVTGSPFAAAPSDLSFTAPFDRIAISQNDQYLYAGTSAGIFAYSINATNGALTEISGSPFGASAGVAGALVAPSTGFLYETIMNSSPTDASPIYGYSIDSSTGALTAISGSPFGSNCGGSNLTSPASGQFLFSADCGMYQINSNTGALSFLFADPTAPYSGWAVFDPAGAFLWIVNSQEPCFDCNIGVTAYQVNANTGTLTMVPNSFFLMQNSQVGSIQAIAVTQ